MTLERETLHVMDDKQRIALVETQTIENGITINAPAPLHTLPVRQPPRLGQPGVGRGRRADLLRGVHPYGTTSYQAVRSAAEVSLKRYRYTGKERDEETGLYYHGRGTTRRGWGGGPLLTQADLMTV